LVSEAKNVDPFTLFSPRDCEGDEFTSQECHPTEHGGQKHRDAPGTKERQKPVLVNEVQ
jgi:hypothetical protein